VGPDGFQGPFGPWWGVGQSPTEAYADNASGVERVRLVISLLSAWT